MNKIIRYKDINLINKEILKDEVIFSRKHNLNFWKLNYISSYLAMFTPALPKFFIERFTNNNDLVMDNFSGRGTTAIVSRQFNRRFVGNDLNPYAYVLNKFKLSKIEIGKIVKEIDYLEKIFLDSKEQWLLKIKDKRYKELKPFYSDNTLAQLLFVRENIGKKWKRTNKENYAILSIMMGLMHGPMRKDGTTIYFSLDMPNTISFTPNYVEKYSNKHNLTKPDVNVFKLTKERLNSIYIPELQQNFDGDIYLWDSTKTNPKIQDNSVSLVITSPPYLNIVNYTSSNWLRLWLLGFDRQELRRSIKLSDGLNRKNYSQFIKSYLLSIQDKVKNGGKVCLVVGDVHNEPLIENVWKEIESDVKFRFYEVYYDYKYDTNKKVTSVMTHKKIKATKIEKVLVLEKI